MRYEAKRYAIAGHRSSCQARSTTPASHSGRKRKPSAGTADAVHATVIPVNDAAAIAAVKKDARVRCSWIQRGSSRWSAPSAIEAVVVESILSGNTLTDGPLLSTVQSGWTARRRQMARTRSGHGSLFGPQRRHGVDTSGAAGRNIGR